MGWLTRVLAPPRPRGTVIARVGRDARGVAIGNDIIQIGTLVVPTRLVVAALVVLVVLGIAAPLLAVRLLRPPGPAVMGGAFNVAVADFGEQDDGGAVHASDSGRQLSQWMFQSLRAEYAKVPPDVAAMLWHDSLTSTEKGVTIGIVPGRTADERALAAAALANKINAHVVVYGNLASRQDPASFAPEFYVASLRDDPGSEIVGNHQLGTPIPLKLPISSPDAALPLNRTLAARGTALGMFTLGLIWDRRGDAEEALGYFRRAEGVRDWADGEGKEIVYLFLGWEQQLLKRYDEAAASFERAVSINPTYARARIGLGNVYYERAQNVPREQRLAAPELDRAIAEYRTAVELAPLARWAQVERTSHGALGGAYRLKGDAYIGREDYEAAAQMLDLAIDEGQRSIVAAPGLRNRQLAHAYLGLGATYGLQAYVRRAQGNVPESRRLYEDAIEAYRQCATHADAEPYDLFLQRLKTEFCQSYSRLAAVALAELPPG